jgi:glycine hydroxymethyltransferase
MVLAATTPAIIDKGNNAGKPSRAKYEIEPGALQAARDRILALLARFPVYPNLDLAFLQKHFPA